MPPSSASEGSSGGRSRSGNSARALKQRLESLAEAGMIELPSAQAAARRRPPAKKASIESAPAAAPQETTRPTSARSRIACADTAPAATDQGSRLALIQQEVAACQLCTALASRRTNTVFGAGPAAARLCFLGEAPGADEDASGLPFVGRAGQLLTKIIEACQLSRDEVYILNVLKCRPPDNRPPQPQEVANCRGYFERQLSAIAPEFICCLGTSAAQALLQTDQPIGKLRGQWFTHGTAAVICTYHPSYLLRNPSAKRHVWDDMKHLMGRMGIEVSPGSAEA